LIYNTSQYKAQEMPRLRKKEHTHHHSFIQSEQNHSIWIGIKSTINNVHHSFNQQKLTGRRRVSEREKASTVAVVFQRGREERRGLITRAREKKRAPPSPLRYAREGENFANSERRLRCCSSEFRLAGFYFT
jgi:hypothetical protein